MIIYSLILITWIFFFVSFFYSRKIRKRKEILTTSTDNYRFTRDYPTIRKYGIIVVVFASIYYFLICALLGWEFRWFYGMFIINAIVIFVLDRFLISIDYKNTNEKILGIKTQIISLIYRRLRGIYTYGFFLLLPSSFLFLGPYTITIPVYACGVSTEMIIETIISSIKEKNSPFSNKISAKRLLIERYSIIDSGTILQRNFFSGNIIITYSRNSSSADIYTSKFFIFKNFQQIYTENPKFAFYSSNKDTLFLKKNVSGSKYITKSNRQYIYHEAYRNEAPKRTILK
ncbi:hypothetical protein [Flavobacterium sp. JP2137]|uniref:hypothetical protein n=1 Tax=Flavobacterium sp. JP2137 TaxID=3414510 RepID=UPI003D2FD18C